MLKKISKSALSLCIVSSFANAQYVPDDFKHFYDFEKHEVVVQLPNNINYIGKAYINYYGIKRFVNEDELKTSLISAGIKKDKLDSVISSMLEGRKSSSVKTSFSYDNRSLDVKVPASYMSEMQGEYHYTELEPSENALILTNRLFGSYYNGSSSGNLTSTGILGLGKGYLKGDATLSSDSSDSGGAEFAINSLKYNQNFDFLALSAGFDAYGVTKGNSTSSLDHASGNDSYYISLESSDNLLENNNSVTKKVYFDIKGAGTVDVVRDGRVVFSQSYQKGQNTIDYRNLPKGNYDVELVIRANGYPENRVKRHINNNDSETSHKGYDFDVTVRQATYEDNKGLYSNDNRDEKLTYFDTTYVKSVFEDSAMFGVTSQSDGEDYGLGVYGKYHNDFFLTSLYYNELDSANYYDASINVSGFDLQYEKYGIEESSESKQLSNLQQAVYGSRPFAQISLSYNLMIGVSSLNFYASQIKYDDFQGSGETIDGNLAVNYQKTIFDDIQLNLGYSRTKSDSWSTSEFVDNVFSVDLDIPLGDQSTTYTSGIESSSESGMRLTNTLNVQRDDLDLVDGVHTRASGSVNNYLDGEQSESSISGSLDMSNDKFTSNAYVNLSNNHNSNMSFNMESTSVITKDSISQTADASESYVKVTSDSSVELDDEHPDYGTLGAESDSGYSTNTPLSSLETIVGLSSFNTYKLDVDNEISGFKTRDANHNVAQKIFSYPGTVTAVENKVEPIVTYLSYFEDFNNQPLDDVSCVGDGCISVSKVGDGIYSVALVKEKPFKIVSNNQYCYVDKNNLGSSNSTKCFPQVEQDANGLQLVKSGLGDKDETIYYLGVYQGKLPKGVIQSGKDAQIAYMKYDFGGHSYLFAKKDNNANELKQSGLITAQISLLKDAQQYVNSNSDINYYAKN